MIILKSVLFMHHNIIQCESHVRLKPVKAPSLVSFYWPFQAMLPLQFIVIIIGCVRLLSNLL